MNTVYLSRKNLLTLLSKLDRRVNGDFTQCTIIKNDVEHKKYPCSAITIVTAVEDADYYIDREAGKMHPLDEPNK